MPGAALGALCTKVVPRQQFNIAFGTILALGSVYLLLRSAPRENLAKTPSAKSTTRNPPPNKSWSTK